MKVNKFLANTKKVYLQKLKKTAQKSQNGLSIEDFEEAFKLHIQQKLEKQALDQ